LAHCPAECGSGRRIESRAFFSQKARELAGDATSTEGPYKVTDAIDDYLVQSVYSETEIFLRELISNASDACDRLRYEAIAKPELTADGVAFAIRKPDGAANTLTVTDRGIGMGR
jgi:molecular chaperone HtpG